MHTVKNLFQARAGQFGPAPEMAFSVVVSVLQGKKIHKFKMKATGLQYQFDAREALEKFNHHKYRSRGTGRYCIVIPLSFCYPEKKERKEVKNNAKRIPESKAAMPEVQKQASFI